MKDYNSILTNFDIEKMCKKLKTPLNGIYMKDEIDKLKNGCYVMNLENKNQGGSHWVSFIITDNTIYYCDSFGLYPPEKVYKMFLNSTKDIYINSKQIQDLKSVVCGYFAIAFLYFFINSTLKTGKRRMEEYLKIWDYEDLRQNDNVKYIILRKI